MKNLLSVAVQEQRQRRCQRTRWLLVSVAPCCWYLQTGRQRRRYSNSGWWMKFLNERKRKNVLIIVGESRRTFSGSMLSHFPKESPSVHRFDCLVHRLSWFLTKFSGSSSAVRLHDSISEEGFHYLVFDLWVNFHISHPKCTADPTMSTWCFCFLFLLY